MSGTYQGQNSTLATPLSIVQRDANVNAAINAMVENTTTVPSATGTTVLTADSSPIQILIGTQIQTFVLPDATTLFLNQSYKFINNSTGDITLQTNDTTLLTTISAGTVVEVFCTSISISAGVWAITPVASGAGGSGTPNPTANTLVERDANVNAAINAISEGVLTTVTSAGTLTLTAASAPLNIFTGSTTHNVVLPDATTLRVNQAYTITNRSSGAVTVNQSSTTLLVTVAANTETTVYCTNNSTSAGAWVTTLPLYGGTVNPTPSFLSISSDTTLTSANIGLSGQLSIYNSSTTTRTITLPKSPALVFSNATWGNSSTTFPIPPLAVLTIATYGSTAVAILSVQEPPTRRLAFSVNTTLTVSNLPWNSLITISNTGGSGTFITLTLPSGYTFTSGGTTTTTVSVRGGANVLVYVGNSASSLAVVSNNSPIYTGSLIQSKTITTTPTVLTCGTGAANYYITAPFTTSSSNLVLPTSGRFLITVTISGVHSATANGQLVMTAVGAGTNVPFIEDSTGFVSNLAATFYGSPNPSATARIITDTFNFMVGSGGTDSQIILSLSMTDGASIIDNPSSFIIIQQLL